MCGRITQKSPPNQLGLSIVSLIEPLHVAPRFNGAPGQEQWVIRQNPKTGERSLDRLWWGLIPHWVKDADGGRKPINAKAETVAAYRRILCRRSRRRTPRGRRLLAGLEQTKKSKKPPPSVLE